MKRKRNQGTPTCAKKPAGGCEAPPPQFLHGVQCHVHPASFGSVRHKIFENNVTRYGGELVPSLPEASDVTLHVVFEESVDEEKLKRLVEVTKLPNSVFLRCTWLVECVKTKAKARTEGHLIISVKPIETQTSREGLIEIGGTQTEDSNRKWLEEANRIQTREINKTQVEETHRKQAEETDSHLQVTRGSLGKTEEREVQDTPLSSDSLFRPTAQPTTPNQEADLPDSLACVLPSAGGEETGNQEEPVGRTVDATCTGEAESTKQHSVGSLIRPFPKYLQEKFACARPSSSRPLDLNAHITSELEKLATTYKSKNDNWRAVGYQRAVSAIRNYNKEIKSREEALAIPGIGGRLADKIAEILESGRLRKVAEVCEGEEAETLCLFLGVWGAGPTTAQTWYYQGLRTLEDLRVKATLTRHQQIGLKHYDDINSRIPRSEVAEIENYVRESTFNIVKGAEVMVCGSYRRGKATCGDVDVLITHPDGHSHELIFKPLLAHLRGTGFLTDDLVTQEDNGNQKKYLGVCRLSGEGRKHRRLDVIVVPYEERATAVMYFTGSAHFNRSMRLLATKKGMSLSEHSLRAGIMRQGGEKLNEGYVLETPTEESIFAHLGLEYRTPEERDH